MRKTESHYRSVLKALSWRFLATTITIIVALIVTGELVFAAKIGLADTIIKLAVYYTHERIWDNLKYGRMKPPEYEI